MKKLFSIFTLFLLLGSMNVFAAEVENGNSTSSVITAEWQEMAEVEVGLLAERLGDDVVVIVNLLDAVDIAAGAFEMKVPNGFEFKNAMEGELLSNTENAIDATQSENGMVNVEFKRDDAGPVSGELMGLIFVGNNNGGIFEISKEDQNTISGVTGNSSKIYGRIVLEKIETSSSGGSQTSSSTNGATNNDTTVVVDAPASPTDSETPSTTQTNGSTTVVVNTDGATNMNEVVDDSGETSTGSTLSGSTDEATGTMDGETTEAETGLGTNLLLLAIALLILGIFASYSRKEEA